MTLLFLLSGCAGMMTRTANHEYDGKYVLGEVSFIYTPEDQKWEYGSLSNMNLTNMPTEQYFISHTNGVTVLLKRRLFGGDIAAFIVPHKIIVHKGDLVKGYLSGKPITDFKEVKRIIAVVCHAGDTACFKKSGWSEW